MFETFADNNNDQESDRWLWRPKNDVECALDDMRHALQLTSGERAPAAEHQRMVREILDANLRGVKRSFLSGSYRRHTAVTPLHDIDIVVVLDRDRRADLLESHPRRSLNAVCSALKRSLTRHPNGPEPLNRAAHIEFKYGKICIDIVPAFEADDGFLLWIPDKREEQWVLTAPEFHIAESTRKNKASGGWLIPIVKIMKHWRNIWDIKLKSFHLEMMCSSAFKCPPESLDVAIHFMFYHLRRTILEPCEDPARPEMDLSNYLNKTLNRKTRITNSMNDALNYSSKAIDLAAQGKISEAHNCWKEIFLDSYLRKFWNKKRR